MNKKLTLETTYSKGNVSIVVHSDVTDDGLFEPKSIEIRARNGSVLKDLTPREFRELITVMTRVHRELH